jgi:uncharacterized protein (TIGR02594 family)
MKFSRRVLIAAAPMFLAGRTWPDDSFARRGGSPALAKDIETANRIAVSMPRDKALEIMQRLSEIRQVGTTGELFNTRWKTIANPLIVRFFHDIGYKKTRYPGDCTPWCAATASWCLQRAGLPIPANPASSQGFLNYGNRVDNPKPGDICVFSDIDDFSVGHVGYFVSKDGDLLSVLGGNQSGDSVTNCGPGYRKSKIAVATLPVNAQRDRSVGVHFLAAYVRPT